MPAEHDTVYTAIVAYGFLGFAWFSRYCVAQFTMRMAADAEAARLVKSRPWIGWRKAYSAFVVAPDHENCYGISNLDDNAHAPRS